jgi:Tol biopolymer transport system component
MFSVSRDERRIAFIDWRGEQRDIWVRPIGGGNPKQITNDTARDGNPVWHPDGERILYNSRRNGVDQICLAFADGSTPVQLTMLDVDASLTDISNDGTRILYSLSRDEADIWKADLITGRTSATTSEVGVEFWPDASTQGQLAYQSGRPASLVGGRLSFNILVHSSDASGGATVITSDGYLAKWSPGGSKIAFLRAERGGRNSLWTASAGGGNPVRVVPQGVLFMGFSPFPFRPGQAEDFSWSPDSSRIAYSDGKSIRTVNSDGSDDKAVSDPVEGSFVYNAIWAPRGERIAVVSSDTARQPWINSIELIEGGRRRRIFQSDQVLRLLGWTNNAGELLVLTVPPKETLTNPVSATLHLVKLDGSEPKTVLNLANVFSGNVCLARDGGSLVWTELVDKLDTMQVLNLATRKVQKAAQSDDERTYLTGLAWAPDGKSIYYSRHSNIRSISMIDNFR